MSIDSKREELIGRVHNNRIAWKQRLEELLDQDFPLQSTGEAVPDGIYDLQAKSGWLGLGLFADSPCFAVACLAAWRATARN